MTESDLSNMFTQNKQESQRKSNDQGPGKEREPYKKKFQTDYMEAPMHKNKKKNEKL